MKCTKENVLHALETLTKENEKKQQNKYNDLIEKAFLLGYSQAIGNIRFIVECNMED